MSVPNVTCIVYRASFQADLVRAPQDIRIASQRAVALLLQNPKAKSLRLHPLTGHGKPTVWKIDILPNHSWQITLEIHGCSAHLLRIARHKILDRNPR